MRALIQRVSHASVTVDGEVTGAIGPGLLVLLGVTHADTPADADRIADKIRALRVFGDADGKMNLPLGDREVLCISQFTLYGDTRKGNRPAYVAAAPPDVAEPLYERVCERLAAQRGVFGAHMDVELVNDGPVTVMVEVPSGSGPLGFTPMPPVERPICQFAAEPPQSSLPYGQWADTLQREFMAACLRVEPEEEGEEIGTLGAITWFPDRSWHGRTYIPATARTSTGLEMFGYVSFAPGEEGDEPSEFYGWADYTADTADQHPDWRLDISQEAVGGWRGEREEVAAMTLVWGVTLVRGGATATAELGPRTVDQCPVTEDRFTLLAPDAYADEYLDVVLWDAGGSELARESLYED